MKKSFLFLFVFILPLAIALIWYRPGLMLATGETAIPFYSLGRNASLTQHAWQEHVLGNPSGFTTISYPLYVILNLLATVVPPGLVQIVLFFILMVVSAVSLTVLLRKKSLKEQGITICFYLCNVGIMVLVWNRFQYTFIFFASLLPAAFALYKKGIDDQKWIYILITNLALVLLSQSFSSLPLIMLFWFIIGGYTLFKSIQLNKWIYPFSFLLGTIILWFLCNSWWIAQYLVLLQNPYVLHEAYSAAGNKDEVIEVSNRLGNLSYVMRMMHKDFFQNIATTWRINYNNPLFVLLSYAITALAYFPLLLKRRKPSYIYFFLIGALGITFLAKGAAPPFGEIFIFLYSQFRFLEAFRNPFEKFSLALPFFYAPLIGYSLYILYEKIGERFTVKIAHYFLIATLLSLCGILVFPMWNRWVFSSTEHPSNNKRIGDYVQVPSYYKEANNFINQNPGEFRNIALPIRGEGITYSWEYGYSGVEPLNGIFDKPIISLSTSLEFLKPIARQLEPLVLYDKEYLSDAMQILNARYIIVRDDINYKIRQMTQPKIINKELGNTPQVTLQKKFGALSIYENEDFLEKIYPATGVITTSDSEENILSHVLPHSEFQKGNIFVATSNLPSSVTSNYIKQEILTARQIKKIEKVKGGKIHVNIDRPSIQKENALLELPHINYVAKSMVYPFVRLKEQWLLASTQGSDGKLLRVRLAGKRLVEISAMLENNIGTAKIPSIATDYNRSVHDLDLQFIFQYPGIQQELAKHEYILERLDDKFKVFTKYPKIKDTHDYISRLFTSGFELEINPTLNEIGEYQVNVPENGDYQLLIDEVHEPKVSTVSAYLFNGTETIASSYPIIKNIQINGEINTINLAKNEDKEFFEDNFTNRIISLSKNHTNFQPINNPEIQFKKINASEYEVMVNQAQQPFILVFSESFHPLWQAEIDNKALDSSQHFLANNFANAWWITKTGNYSVRLYFKAENDLKIGKIISIATTILAAMTAGIVLLKKRK